jgi:UDP-N-acetylglucosamine 1-carboxyvinyltransferase
MDKLIINGKKKLAGEVVLSGAKNASLPIMAASLLSPEKTVLRNVPFLKDIDTMAKLLRHLGASVSRSPDGSLEIEPGQLTQSRAPYEVVSTMRASVCVLGPLLARLGRAEVSHPGGCVIGPRPIDLHVKGLRKLGALITVEHGYVRAECGRLAGSEVYLGGPFGSTVLGTANIMTAASLAGGVTLIENAACEPEIVDLGNFLISMGAEIDGLGSHTVRIRGKKKLRGAVHNVIPDRIEAGTYMVAAAVCGGDVFLKNAVYGHMHAVIDKLESAGLKITCDNNGIRARAPGKLQPVDATTMPYPGFPTDMQAQIMTLMLAADGISIITERIYPDRFMHVSELLRMGADIIREGERAIVKGGARLSGAKVMASDLRASAGLVLAGLMAEGETEILRIYHLARGYERMDEKLRALGADVKTVSG